jgi:serine/threonine-protein kinase
MEPERWRQVDALFAAALDLAPGERAGFLERACGADRALAEAVGRLLAADEEAHTFLERPAALAARGDAGDTLAPGTRVGPYRVERPLGRGGMGAVYLAARDDGLFERRVALKLIRHGVRHPEALDRFRAERQVLARLEHPAIARLYDGGETAEGVPYLAMEYVEGEPLDAYCDRRRLPVAARLQLFLRLLDGVAYAHQNLLVHRDIKPGNVLVTAAGEPKLLDFGIAKRLDPGTGDAAVTRLRPMTPGYASPEQVRGEAVTTASDVYSLGAVLYELLAGRSPYRLGSDLPHELEAAILEQEPEPPSQAVAGAAAPQREAVCAARRARPRELVRRLRGDLDTIVLCALRKDPRRRYRTVGEMAADIDGHSKALPIAARPDTVLYRTSRFVRRHRLGVVLAGAALAAMAVLFAGALRERDHARRERDKARQALAFLTEVFERADPYQKGAGQVSARELLAIGARRAERELGGDPEVQAALLDAIGRASVGLGQVAEGAPLLERALALRRTHAPGSPELAGSLEEMGFVEFLASDFAAAEALLREAVALRRRLGGADSPELAFALNRLGTVLSEALQTPEPARLGEIEALHREALAIYRRRPEPAGLGVSTALFQLAKVSRARGDLAQAEARIRQSLAVAAASLGETHPETLQARRFLAQILIARGALAPAEEQLRRTLAAQRRVLPADHPDIAWTANDLGLVRVRRGDFAGAEAQYRVALAFALDQRGAEHAETAIVLANLGAAVQEQGRLVEAAELHERALAIRRALYGERHVFVAQSLGNLARVRSAQGRHDEALDLARRSLALNRALLPADHHELASPLRTIGAVLLARGEPEAALPHLRDALERVRRGQGPNSLFAARIELLLGECLAALGRRDEAEELLRRGERTLAAILPADHPLLGEARGELGLVRGRN